MKEDKLKEDDKIKELEKPAQEGRGSLNEVEWQLTECQKQKNEYLEGWKRERADFLNYKKEEMERIMELVKYANEEIVLKILPILDNFLVAEKSIPDELKKDEHPEGDASRPYGASIKGFLQIHQQLKDFLKSQGIEEIRAVGVKFDPNFMEVVEEVEGDKGDKGDEGNMKESGVVVEEIQKGYTMNGKVIRPARVKISK